MPPYTGPNRVPKSTYDNLKKNYDKLIVCAGYGSACRWYINFMKKLYRELNQMEKDFINNDFS